MKFLFQFCLLIPWLILPLVSFPQVALNGILDIKPYAGLQPDLVKGVSALPASEAPVIRHVYMIDKNIVALTIDERAVIYDNLKPYKKQKGDTMIMTGYHGMSKLLERKGEPVGYLCGLGNNWYRPFNIISGDKLDVLWASKANNYALISNSKSQHSKPLYPTKIYRKTVPNGRSHVDFSQEYTLCHEIYLVFSEDLEPGRNYSIQFGAGSPFTKALSFIYDDHRLRSEAIHVNMLGYAPEDHKTAFLSSWLGDGGGHTYPQSMAFKIIDVHSSETVLNGTSSLKKKAQIPEYNIEHISYNHNLTDIHALDFSSLKKPGTYRLVVPGIGCSFDFEIRGEIWELTARLLMKGFLHQRSGIELGPPYTDYQRPRNMHPNDETVINKCDPERFYNPPGEVVGGGQSSVFERISASILPDTEVPEAWGGWMDAGDFDQRMSHLYSVRRMMYLYELNPAYFESLNLNIPESTNTLPDILDEAAWCLDLYRRTQGVYEEGGVSWWVESVTHPRQGEPSWLNSLPTALIPPSPRAGLHYCATAAQMSLLVKKFDPELSEEYLQSALDAMKWVEAHPNAPDLFGSNPRKVIEAIAYVNLYRRTGDKEWHKRLTKTVEKVFPSGIVEDASIGNAEILTNYLLIKDMYADPELTQNCSVALVALADNLLVGAEQTAFDILKSPDGVMTRTVSLGRKILPIVMAHQITKDKKYKVALSNTIQYTMGANPMNRTYISGLGERTFTPYQLDWECNNMNKPAGIPNFGPTVQTETTWGWSGEWAILAMQEAGLYPNKMITWPFVEKCFNNTWIAPINEFTVRGPMGELLLLTGYLAQEEFETVR